MVYPTVTADRKNQTRGLVLLLFFSHSLFAWKPSMCMNINILLTTKNKKAMKAKTIFSAACKILTFVVATIDVFELGKTYYNKKNAGE